MEAVPRVSERRFQAAWPVVPCSFAADRHGRRATASPSGGCAAKRKAQERLPLVAARRRPWASKASGPRAPVRGRAQRRAQRRTSAIGDGRARGDNGRSPTPRIGGPRTPTMTYLRKRDGNTFAVTRCLSVASSGCKRTARSRRSFSTSKCFGSGRQHSTGQTAWHASWS